MAEPFNTTIARVAISKRLRFEVFKRDGFTCQYCGATPPGALLECDHIHPVSLGGSTDEDNLITACFDCNRGKSDVPLGTVIQTMAERAAETLERESQIAGYEAVMREKRMRIDADAREILEAFCSEFGRDGIPKRDFTSIKRFIEQIGLDSCIEATEISCNKFRWSYNKAFRYFCGICWNRIRGPREEIEGEEA
jgi:HNH endonuclease